MTLLASNYARLFNANALVAARLKVGLVAAYLLDEASGTRRDHSGLGNGLDVGTAPTGATGPSGRLPAATQFARASSHYLIASDAPVHTFTSNMTAICWVYVDSKPAAEMQLFAKDDTVGQREYGLFLTNATDRFRWVQGNATWGVLDIVDADALGSPGTATWYMIEVDVDVTGALVGIRVNNGTRNTVAKSTTMVDGTQGVTVGARGGATPALFFDGRIAGLLMWNRLLTDPERTWLYSLGAGRSASELGWTA